MANDYLQGDEGDDTYLFAAGDGNTVIYNEDSGAGRWDVLRFMEGIAPSDVSVTRLDDDLRLTLQSTGEVITVLSYFVGDGAGGYALNSIEFADGTHASIDTIKALVLQGTAGDDTLYGYATDDTLYGGAGNDTLYGGAGHDILKGGGVGSENYLEGGSGNDTYVYDVGDGNVTIYNDDSAVGRWDVLYFQAGVSPGDVMVSRVDDDLQLSLQSTGEVITVSSYFVGDGAGGFALNLIEFADGTRADIDTIKALVQQGSAGDDTLYGYAGADTLVGGGGNDTLLGQAGDDIIYAGEGDDTLIGGAGHDALQGGGGSDTYLFATGSGNDVVYNGDLDPTSVDVAVFEGVNTEDLWFSRNANHLQINVAGSDDQVIVDNWYSNEAYQLDQIEVGNSALLNNQVEQLVSAMASYGVPSGVGNVIPQDVRDALQPVLAETWQVV